MNTRKQKTFYLLIKFVCSKNASLGIFREVSFLFHRCCTILPILFVTSCLFSAVKCYAQDSVLVVRDEFKPAVIAPPAVNTIIKINPLPILMGPIPNTAEYRLVMEFTTSINQSSQFGISYLDRSPLLNFMEDSTGILEILIIRGLRFQAAYKLYSKKDKKYAPKGLYVSPHFSYSTAKFTTKQWNSLDGFIRITHYNVNLLVGYQIIPGNVFAIDVFAGWGYKKHIWIIQETSQNVVNMDTSDLPSGYNSPFKFTLGFNMGIAF